MNPDKVPEVGIYNFAMTGVPVSETALGIPFIQWSTIYSETLQTLKQIAEVNICKVSPWNDIAVVSFSPPLSGEFKLHLDFKGTIAISHNGYRKAFGGNHIRREPIQITGGISVYLYNATPRQPLKSFSVLITLT